MRRREFIAGLGATAWPLSARAQQAAIPVIGFLNSRSASEAAGVVDAFRQGLRRTGFVEGENVTVQFRWAEGRYDRLPALASELVRRQVSVLAATTTPAVFAAKEATVALFIANSASVLLLSYLVPWTSRWFLWWLAPEGPNSRWLQVAGAALVIVLYGLMLLVFGWLL
jgi:hypothetical protein